MNDIYENEIKVIFEFIVFYDVECCHKYPNQNLHSN